MNGTGTLVLTAYNTYLGATTVAEGRLLVDGADLFPVTVQSGGTLGGTGTIGVFNRHTIESGGTLAPGDDGAGVLHAWQAACRFRRARCSRFRLGGTGAGQFDQGVGQRHGELGGATLDVSLINGFVPTVGNSFRIIDNDGSSR